jgi:septum formation protein
MQLLRQLVSEFEVCPSTVDEDALTVADPWETAKVLALAKAQEVSELRPGSLVIGSDTVVAVEIAEGTYEQLTKPSDPDDAARMLRRLSGRCHLVITGLALVAPNWSMADADTTTVCFRELAEAEVRGYIASGESMDKAGGYAIQGGASEFVARTEGSIDNVVGLPTELLETMLADFANGAGN